MVYANEIVYHTNHITPNRYFSSTKRFVFLQKIGPTLACALSINIEKNTFYLETRDTLKTFTLLITVKTTSKLNLEKAINSKHKFKTLAVVAHVLQAIQNLSFPEDGKEIYQEL